MPIARIILCAAFAVPVAVHAQTTKAQSKQVPPKTATIKNEGDSFLGIPFSNAFPGDMAPCPVVSGAKFVDLDAIKTMATPCYSQVSANEFNVWNGPDLGIGHGVSVITYRGLPLRFRLSVARERFPDMVKVFTSRYGKPHITEVYPAYTRAGENFQFQSHYWKGKRIEILLDEGSKDIRWSEGFVNVRAADELFEAEKKRATEAAAGKL